MGSGASTLSCEDPSILTHGSGISGSVNLTRLRKSLLIRAYNVRHQNTNNSRNNTQLTLEDQFRPYAYVKRSNTAPYTGLVITVDGIKQCLALDPNNRDNTTSGTWVDDLCKYSLGADSTSEIVFADFIRFLESGKLPGSQSSISPIKGKDNDSRWNGPTPSRSASRTKLSENVGNTPPEPEKASFKIGSEKKLPPFPPAVTGLGAVPAAVSREEIQILHIEKEMKNQEETEEDEVITINLGQLQSGTIELGGSVKLHSLSGSIDGSIVKKASEVMDTETSEPTLSVMIHPSKRVLGSPSAQRALWRKREVVKHEKTTHYTTLDPDGQLQELVERETTQTEVLHMECRETGEFAHRELTRFEQQETFNEELVNEQQGQEEYVHLKSLEDEFHYMHSTMPQKPDRDETEQPQSEQDRDRDSEAADAKAKELEREELDKEREIFTRDEAERQWAMQGDGEEVGAGVGARASFIDISCLSPTPPAPMHLAAEQGESGEEPPHRRKMEKSSERWRQPNANSKEEFEWNQADVQQGKEFEDQFDPFGVSLGFGNTLNRAELGGGELDRRNLSPTNPSFLSSDMLHRTTSSYESLHDID